MIIFRICDVTRGETSPRIEPRAFYKAYLHHVNRRDSLPCKVRVTTTYVGKNIVKTAYIFDATTDLVAHEVRRAA